MTGDNRAAIYCRISSDPRLEARGVQRQEDDCRALAARAGLDVVGVYIENDTGASDSARSRKKPRPQYEAMLAAARAGEFGNILAYSNSRLTRRPKEFEALIDLHRDNGIRIRTVVSGEDNLSTADGRQRARIMADIDAGEAERTGERVKRKHLELARAGKPVGGTRPFGWMKDKATLNPAEAELIRAAAADVMAGVPLRRIVQDWNDRDVLTSTGRAWSSQVMRQMLRNPRLAGWRIYQGEIALDENGEKVRGQWEPILDDETSDAVIAALTKPDNRERLPRKGARHYLLTGMLRCGVCNGPMYGNRNQWGHAYACKGEGHSNVAAGPAVDARVAAAVVLRMQEAELPETPDAGTAQAQSRLTQVSGQIAELMAAFRAAKLSGALVFGQVKELEAEQAELRKIIERPTARPVERLDEDAWLALDTDRQRAVAEGLLDAVYVRAATHRTNRFDPERLAYVWRS